MYFTIPTILALISSTISVTIAAFIPQGGIESADFVLVAPSPSSRDGRDRSRRHSITKKLSKADCKQMDQHLSEISKAIMVLQQHNNSTKNIDYDSEEVQDMYKMFIPLVSADENKGRDFEGSNNIPIVISAHETYQSTPPATQSDDNPLLLLAELQQLQQQPQQQHQQSSGKEAVILEGIKDIKTNQQFERIERLIKERANSSSSSSSSSPPSPPPAKKQCSQCQKAKKAKKAKKASSGSSSSSSDSNPIKSAMKSATKTASTSTSTSTSTSSSNPTDNIAAAKTLVY